MSAAVAAASPIERLKCERLEEARSLALPLHNAAGARIGALVPVGRWILADAAAIESLRAWRQKAMRMFLTQFQATREGTAAHLATLAEGGGSILFMIDDAAGRPIGHIGLTNVRGGRAELDNLMRGVDGGDPRLVHHAETALLDWCFEVLRIEAAEVRVLSYNWLVLALHEEVGFTVIEEQRLLKQETGGGGFAPGGRSRAVERPVHLHAHGVDGVALSRTAAGAGLKAAAGDRRSTGRGAEHPRGARMIRLTCCITCCIE